MEGLVRFFERKVGEHVKACARAHRRKKGFWTVHGEDALLVAKDHFRTMAVVKYIGGSAETNGIPRFGFIVPRVVR